MRLLLCRGHPGLMLGILAVLAIVLATCGADGQDSRRDPLNSVPANAASLASIRVDLIRSDPDVQSLTDGLYVLLDEDLEELLGADQRVPETLAEALALGKQVTGIDFTRTREILYYSTGPSITTALGSQAPGSSAGESAALIQGPYNRSAVLQFLNRQAADEGTPVTTETYRGQTLWLLPLNAGLHRQDDLTVPDRAALVFLASDLVAIGTPASLRAVIDARLSRTPPLSGALRERLQAQRHALFNLVSSTPPGQEPSPQAREALERMIQESLGGATPLPPGLLELANARESRITVKKDVTRFALELQSQYPDAATAAKARDVLAGLASLGKALAPQPELKAALEKAKVSSRGASVTVSLRLRASEALDLFRALKETREE